MVNLSSFTNKRSSKTGFLTFEASLAFTQLKKTFTKAPYPHHFDPKHYIQIKTDASGYAIGEVLSQLTTKRDLTGQVTHKDQLINLPSEIGQWHPVAFFFRKMIPTETRYKIHN